MIVAGWRRSWKIALAVFLFSLAVQVFIVVPKVAENQQLLGVGAGDQGLNFLAALIDVSIGAAIWFAVGYGLSSIRNWLKRRKEKSPKAVSSAEDNGDFENSSAKQQDNTVSDATLPFKNVEAAFEYACKYMENTLVEGSILPATVVDAAKMFGVPSAIKQNEDGTQLATIKVASDDGGFIAIAQTLGKGPALQVGDFVAWQAGAFNKELADAAEDKRTGWVGIIMGTLETTWEKDGWLGKARFK